MTAGPTTSPDLPAHLVVEGETTAAVPIAGEIVIGRDSACQIRIEGDGEVSRCHARVFSQGERFCVEDLKSRNGTFVNDARARGVVPLNDGDVIRIGRRRIRFATGSSVAAAIVPGQQILRSMSGDPSEFLGAAGTPAMPMEQAWQRLQVLYTVCEAVSALEDEREVGSVVLREVFRIVPAERGAILLQQPGGPIRIAPRPTRSRSGWPTPGRASRPSSGRGFSSPSPRSARRAVPGWACRSAGTSWRTTGAGSSSTSPSSRGRAS
jgi:predicted component of type VI protein secretion system